MLKERCSAIGPRAATGRNKSAPTRTIVPTRTSAKVGVSVRRVPAVNGVGFLAASDAVVLIPQQPLSPGQSYTVSISINGQSRVWTFRVAP